MAKITGPGDTPPTTPASPGDSEGSQSPSDQEKKVDDVAQKLLRNSPECIEQMCPSWSASSKPLGIKDDRPQQTADFLNEYVLPNPKTLQYVMQNGHDKPMGNPLLTPSKIIEHIETIRATSTDKTTLIKDFVTGMGDQLTRSVVWLMPDDWGPTIKEEMNEWPISEGVHHDLKERFDPPLPQTT